MAHRAPKNPCNSGFQQSDALLCTAHAVHFQLAPQAEKESRNYDGTFLQEYFVYFKKK